MCHPPLEGLATKGTRIRCWSADRFRQLDFAPELTGRPSIPLLRAWPDGPLAQYSPRCPGMTASKYHSYLLAEEDGHKQPWLS
jgi:hypothetical protein